MSFGPLFLPDKSTIQGLSFECIKMLMRFYRHPISPILLRELTSDLAKEENGYTDEDMKKKVSLLAAKMSSFRWTVLPDALGMVCGELLHGGYIPMDGIQVPCESMIKVTTPRMGQGFFLDEHPMLAILRNWADGTFTNEYLLKAKAIREEDSTLDLDSLYNEVDQETDEEAKVPNFLRIEDVVNYADTIRFFYKTPRQIILRVARYFFQDKQGLVGAVMRRWRCAGRPPLKYFAPYAMYVHRVDIVYHYCLLRRFIKRTKKGKAHLDMQYFYYLPFCKIFSSDDKDVVKLAPFFLREDQIFINKADLQRDLKNLSTYFEGLSPEESEAFREEFRMYPPDLEGSFTSEMWKKFMSPRQKNAGKKSSYSPEEEKAILDRFKEIEKAVENQRTKEANNAQRANSTICL